MPVTRAEQSSEAAGGWEPAGELGFEGQEAHKAWAGWGPVCGGIYFGMGVLNASWHHPLPCGSLRVHPCPIPVWT